MVIIYFSGHGVQEGDEMFLVPTDGRIKELAQTRSSPKIFVDPIAFALTDNAWEKQRASGSRANEVLQVMQIGPGDPMTVLNEKFSKKRKRGEVAMPGERSRGKEAIGPG
jgi:hypothetical protein